MWTETLSPILPRCVAHQVPLPGDVVSHIRRTETLSESLHTIDMWALPLVIRLMSQLVTVTVSRLSWMLPQQPQDPARVILPAHYRYDIALDVGTVRKTASGYSPSVELAPILAFLQKAPDELHQTRALVHEPAWLPGLFPVQNPYRLPLV